MSGRDNPGLLLDSMSVSVPLLIGRLREAGEDARAELATKLRDERLTGGDALLYGGRSEEVAGAHARFAAALAVLAFNVGGVRFGPLGWCAAHPRQRWADGDKVCMACLAEEIAAKAEAARGESR